MGDVNRDGVVSILDATYIQRYLVELDSYAKVNTYVYVTEEPTEPTTPSSEPTTEPETQPAGTRTIYLDNSKFSASDPHIYVWKNGTTESVAAWPGEKMTKVSDTIYSYTCPEEYNCCIFSKDGGSNSKISGNLENIPYTSAIYDGEWKEYSSISGLGTIPPTAFGSRALAMFRQ